MVENTLQRLIDIWSRAAADNVSLLRSLDPADWDSPTDLPGWTVRAVAAHLAHLESELAGNSQDQVEVPEAPHVRGPMGQFTEAGPVARSAWSTDAIVDELEQSVAKRRADLEAKMPLDPNATADGFAGLVGWTWATLLSNRPLDHWMHEQDIRRAVSRPGGLDSAPARHVLGVFGKSLGYVLSKRVGASAGTSLVVHVTGPIEATYAVGVGEDGRGAPLPEVPEQPDVRLTMDLETFAVLSGGRRRADQVAVVVEGDEVLGRAVLDNMGVTP
jgi:uncharacterized protein (TIGR03083 family)